MMTTLHQVTCVTRCGNNDPQQCITHIGGLNPKGRTWRLSVAEAIGKILDGSCIFFVMIGERKLNLVVGVNRLGMRYIRTEVDDGDPTMLLLLPTCML